MVGDGHERVNCRWRTPQGGGSQTSEPRRKTTAKNDRRVLINERRGIDAGRQKNTDNVGTKGAEEALGGGTFPGIEPLSASIDSVSTHDAAGLQTKLTWNPLHNLLGIKAKTRRPPFFQSLSMEEHHPAIDSKEVH
ncbi:hypothetical protein VTN77DRAFT_9490 [Rasamsonia byssochlamydoides]|uniref:uncharacterized protein n=1 Tax=Rasamsonia byssochlamydoides TaxID=89139 RepID=UPI003743E8F7